jgi:hypothetical protein
MSTAEVTQTIKLSIKMKGDKTCIQISVPSIYANNQLEINLTKKFRKRLI